MIKLKHITTTELNELKEKAAKKFEHQMKDGEEIDLFQWRYFSTDGESILLCQFPNCDAGYILKGCPVCGSDDVTDEIRNNGDGSTDHCLKCNTLGCEHKSEYWTCTKCGKENYYIRVWGLEKRLISTMYRLMPPSYFEKVSKPERCFIATSVYGSSFAQEVLVLRQFRDSYLIRSNIGRKAVQFYYYVSPSIARFLDSKPNLSKIVRKFMLQPIVNCCRRKIK